MARTKSTARPMISEELPAVGVLSASENVPPSTSTRVTEAAPESGGHEEGEIRSGRESDANEDISNVEANLSELIAAKVTSYSPAFVFGKSKVTTELIKEYEEAGFFLLVTVVLLLTKRPLLLRPTKSLFSRFFHLWS